MMVMQRSRADRPRLEPRVRMRVKVKVKQTTLPLAHDEVFTEHGKLGVKQGEHEIVVFRSDVAKVLAKVETETGQVRAAHDIFWRGCLAAVTETNSRIRQPIDMALCVVPDHPVPSTNKWVELHWPQIGQELYYRWLTTHCHEDRRSPQAIFRGNMGRSMKPLESAEIIDGPDIDAPVPEEQQQTLAMVELVRRAAQPVNASNGAEVAALKAENDALRARQAETDRKLDSLLAKLGEPGDGPKAKGAKP